MSDTETDKIQNRFDNLFYDDEDAANDIETLLDKNARLSAELEQEKQERRRSVKRHLEGRNDLLKQLKQAIREREEAMKALRGCDIDAQQDRGLLALGKRLIELECERNALRDRLAALEELVRDANAGRCMTCSWPLAKDADEGCIPGNCPYRPSPVCQDYPRVKARREALAAVPRVSTG